MEYNVEEIRKDFKQLNEKNIYLDTAATALKPKVVVDSIVEYYNSFNGNSHSKMSIYGDKTSELVENSREIVAKYLSCEKENIIFTKSATESLNTCVFGIEDEISEKDEILLSILEHHANIVPYQVLAKKKNANMRFVYLNEDYSFNYDEFEQKITENTKIIGITMQSNVTGEEIDIEKVCEIVEKRCKELKNRYAFVFSGHKIYGPQGVRSTIFK